jgi:hypothetical protein
MRVNNDLIKVIITSSAVGVLAAKLFDRIIWECPKIGFETIDGLICLGYYFLILCVWIFLTGIGTIFILVIVNKLNILEGEKRGKHKDNKPAKKG